MATCPTCRQPAPSRFMSMRDLAAAMPKPAWNGRTVGAATMRDWGRRIATQLGLTLVVVDGIEFVARAEFDRAAGVEVAA